MYVCMYAYVLKKQRLTKWGLWYVVHHRPVLHTVRMQVGTGGQRDVKDICVYMQSLTH